MLMFKIKKKEIEKINGALHNKRKVKLKETTRKKISISVTAVGAALQRGETTIVKMPQQIY